MIRQIAMIIVLGVSSGLMAGSSVTFTAPLPHSTVVRDASAYVGTWELVSLFDHTYSDDMQVIIRTDLNSNDALRATMSEIKPDGQKTMEMPEDLNFFRIGKHVYLGSPKVRITTDSHTNSIFLHTIKFHTVTNHIAKGILTGTVTEWDHHSYIVKVTSTTEELVKYLKSGNAQFSESPTVVLKRK
jgi:hypothetical protein